MKKIKYLDIKNILKQNSIDVNSDLSDDVTLLSVKTLINSTENDLTFFSNLKYLDDLSNIKAKACLIEKKYIKYLPNHCKPIIVDNPYLALAIISNIFRNKLNLKLEFDNFEKN